MARKVDIDGTKYTVTDSLGFVQDVGAYVVEVETPEGFKKAVKRAGKWRFWTAHDRTQPLRDEVERQRRLHHTGNDSYD